MILQTLRDLGYSTHWKVLNALHFGVPQKRERIFIVGFSEPRPFVWPAGSIPMTPLSCILEEDEDVPEFYWASDKIRQARMAKREGKKVWDEPTIWHENKGGNVSAYPYSCALRAGASYNYLLVNGVRRLTEREMLRLQGFPDTFQTVGGYAAARKQIGNSVAVPCVAAVLRRVLDAFYAGDGIYDFAANGSSQGVLLMDKPQTIVCSARESRRIRFGCHNQKEGFQAEFPQSAPLAAFLEERGYLDRDVPVFWRTHTDEAVRLV